MSSSIYTKAPGGWRGERHDQPLARSLAAHVPPGLTGREAARYPLLSHAEGSPAAKRLPRIQRFSKVREQLPEYLRSITTMGYLTGMRLGEILGLRWKNVSFLDAEIRLDAGSTKNGDPRTIPLAGELLELLKIERQKNITAESLFAHDGQPIKIFRKGWKSACKRAGLTGLLFHDLRRTGVRNLVRAGVPERVAMAISGHKTRAVFERYNIVSGRDLKDATRKLETYLAAQNGPSSGQIDPLASTEEGSKIAVVN